ncbi:MAG: preprotein translocase subunit SecE, partial [Phycisphaeraceae bacterium]|nr:preprotein translocase subunit SecE [Phycisphaeraceae bacterium]
SDSDGGPSPFYKAGQGFWVRWMTAALTGLLIAAGAGWMWQQLGIVSLPTPTWRMTVRDAGLAISPEQPVELVMRGGHEGEFVKIGTATAKTWETASKGQHQLVVGNVAMEGTQGTPDTQGVRDPAKPASVMMLEGRAIGIPIFQRVYLQAGGAGLMLVGGAFMIYWLVGLKPRTVDFLVATDAEMKKVNWSTRHEITMQTQVVIVAFFLIAALIFAIDFVFQAVFKFLHVIRLG